MNRMKELRQERGITMKDAAQQLNLPYTTYVNYEKGTREPNSETLIQIANFYNTSIDYLLGKSDTRIDDKVLDIVNELDFDALSQAGNIRDALKAANEQPPSLPASSRSPKWSNVLWSVASLAENPSLPKKISRTMWTCPRMFSAISACAAKATA